MATRAMLTRLVDGSLEETATYRVRDRDGSWHDVEATWKNLLDDPDVEGIVIHSRDVTERRRLECQLDQMHRLTGLGRLAAQIAHEFNNVLMGIQPLVEVIRRRYRDDDGLLRMMSVMAGSLDRGKRITHDILRFARPVELTLKPIAVAPFLADSVEEIRRLLGPAMHLDVIEPDIRLAMNGDRAQLTQVMINLAINARDAMAEDGTLTISAYADRNASGATVHVEVRDTGEGIAAGNLSHIFEPLFTTKRAGTGLGLSVVHQVIARHGGRIWAESEVGKGTAIHFVIPAAADGAPLDEGPPAEDAARPHLRVLLVEDDEAVAEGIMAVLQAENIDVRLARRGAEAVPLVESFEPELVILDVGLPDSDGRELYDAIVRIRPNLPVVFSTGHVTEAELERYLQLKNVAFLLKPYTMQELLKAIGDLVLEA
jgi:signal transduction histidine kinase